MSDMKRILACRGCGCLVRLTRFAFGRNMAICSYCGTDEAIEAEAPATYEVFYRNDMVGRDVVRSFGRDKNAAIALRDRLAADPRFSMVGVRILPVEGDGMTREAELRRDPDYAAEVRAHDRKEPRR